ncbi:MAG: type II toxin-antitoxin system RelE/ParE family toxin [Pseudobdellovibrionaceae bacterium]
MAQIEPKLKGKVISTIAEGIEILSTFPEIAEPAKDEKYKHMRELFVPFGKAGYSVLYEYDTPNKAVYIAALRHTREAGYNV